MCLVVTVEADNAYDAARLARALTSCQSITLRGSRLEVMLANQEEDRTVTRLLSEVETFLTDEGLEPVTVDLNGDELIVRPR